MISLISDLMASRGGRMVEGTDGGDHLFRERVANQYQVPILKTFVGWRGQITREGGWID